MTFSSAYDDLKITSMNVTHATISVGWPVEFLIHVDVLQDYISCVALFSFVRGKIEVYFLQTFEWLLISIVLSLYNFILGVTGKFISLHFGNLIGQMRLVRDCGEGKMLRESNPIICKSAAYFHDVICLKFEFYYK